MQTRRLSHGTYACASGSLPCRNRVQSAALSQMAFCTPAARSRFITSGRASSDQVVRYRDYQLVHRLSLGDSTTTGRPRVRTERAPKKHDEMHMLTCTIDIDASLTPPWRGTITPRKSRRAVRGTVPIWPSWQGDGVGRVKSWLLESDGGEPHAGTSIGWSARAQLPRCAWHKPATVFCS